MSDIENNSKWSDQKKEKKLNKLTPQLEKWGNILSDFESIIASEVEFIYSSDESYIPVEWDGNHMVTKSVIGPSHSIVKEVSIFIRPGKLSKYVHENRHGFQTLNGLAGFNSVYDWGDELDAFRYEQVFNYQSVYKFRMQAQYLQDGNKNASTTSISLKKAIEILYTQSRVPSITPTWQNLKFK